MDNGASSYRRFREDGDDNGLVEIIKDYKDGLTLFLYNIVGDLVAAEDLAEDTFVLLGTKKPRDSKKSSFKTWLYTIGRNLAIDYIRKRSRRNEVAIKDDMDVNIMEDSLESIYLRKERDSIIHAALKRLKLEYRQVLWLHYFEEMSCKECAYIMKKTVHSIETLIYRAKQALKVILEQEGFQYENM